MLFILFGVFDLLVSIGCGVMVALLLVFFLLVFLLILFLFLLLFMLLLFLLYCWVWLLWFVCTKRTHDDDRQLLGLFY